MIQVDQTERAFPVPDGNITQFGMPLRDYFAAKAMQGLMGRTWTEFAGQELVDTWAKSAYAVADAMLLERLK